jgi:hypothetical protein
LRCKFIVLNFLPGLLDLRLRFGPSLGDHGCPCLERFMTSRFLAFEKCRPSFPQSLLVFCSPGFRCRNIRPRPFHCARSPAMAFRQNFDQGLVDHRGVDSVEQNQEDDRGHGTEQ